MPLTGEAKREYDREYKRRKKADPVEAERVRAYKAQYYQEHRAAKRLHSDIVRREDALPELPPVTRLEVTVAELAACKGQTALFQEPVGTAAQKAERAAICRSCVVFAGCRRLIDQLEQSTWFAGYWAGESPNERQARRRNEVGRRRAA